MRSGCGVGDELKTRDHPPAINHRINLLAAAALPLLMAAPASAFEFDLDDRLDDVDPGPAVVGPYVPFTLFGEADEGWAQMSRERMPDPPLTKPFFSEDAMITSDVRPYFVYHDFPNSSPIDGGSAKVYAAQVHLALTDNLQFVAYKDGFIDFDSGLIDDEGLVDLAAGIKWAFYQNYEDDLHLTVGAGYELGIGDDEVLQDDDELRLFLAASKGFGRLHVSGTFNYFFPVGGEDDFGDNEHLTRHCTPTTR